MVIAQRRIRSTTIPHRTRVVKSINRCAKYVCVGRRNFREHAAILSRVDDPKKRVDTNIFDLFGDAQVVGMVCPRPVMIQMGENDTLFDLAGERREAKKAASHYKKLGIGGSFEFSVHSGGHVFEIESIFTFLDKHLGK